MKTLFVNACVRPESRTKILADYLLDKLGGEIEEVNLEKENIQPLNYETMLARDEMIKNPGGSDYMLKYAKQFAAADIIVIAAPYWDLSFPAMVKNYLESVTVQGVTFYYNEEGIPQGLCKAQKVYYVMTAGGPTSMPEQSFNFGFDYVKGLCQMLYGIKDVKCFKAEMLDVIGMDVEAILDKAKETIDNEPVE